ncbi:hypothetical protein ALC57_11072 [Trachymyrmex cornetzi]|uniref:Uncharacterized protein n=1 Tax=Trachymyrmex cornetzi TaxID=471704 RepID=A0A195DUK9_9HYME|nr:hypothetical protein ALC57_11072 [Trachymyrmex cornetzi]
MSSPPKHRRGFDPNDPTEFHRYRRVKTKQRGQRFRSHGGASAERHGGSWRCSSTGAFHCTFAAPGRYWRPDTHYSVIQKPTGLAICDSDRSHSPLFLLAQTPLLPGAPLGGTHSPFASDRQGYARQSQQRGCRGGPGRN